eukprot:scaffold483886_cov34-Prasinocladus_malaysianus.AAC.1
MVDLTPQIFPALVAHDPDLILISAGFDGITGQICQPPLGCENSVVYSRLRNGASRASCLTLSWINMQTSVSVSDMA